MSKIAILYSSVDGHTYKISKRLKKQIEKQNGQVELMPMASAKTNYITGFDTIVIGASIRYGKHRPSVTAFINKHEKLLETKQSAFFSVNAVARKPNKNTPDTNPYVKKLFEKINWQPSLKAVFGGKIDYAKYNVFDKFMIRLIMFITKGGSEPVMEFTNWQQVDSFGEQLAQLSRA